MEQKSFDVTNIVKTSYVATFKATGRECVIDETKLTPELYKQWIDDGWEVTTFVEIGVAPLIGNVRYSSSLLTANTEHSKLLLKVSQLENERDTWRAAANKYN